MARSPRRPRGLGVGGPRRFGRRGSAASMRRRAGAPSVARSARAARSNGPAHRGGSRRVRARSRRHRSPTAPRASALPSRSSQTSRDRRGPPGAGPIPDRRHPPTGVPRCGGVGPPPGGRGRRPSRRHRALATTSPGKQPQAPQPAPQAVSQVSDPARYRSPLRCSRRVLVCAASASAVVRGSMAARPDAGVAAADGPRAVRVGCMEVADASAARSAEAEWRLDS